MFKHLTLQLYRIKFYEYQPAKVKTRAGRSEASIKLSNQAISTVTYRLPLRDFY